MSGIMKKRSYFLAASLIVLCFCLCSLSGATQFGNQGALNTWTTRAVRRQNQDGETAYTAYVKVVRVAKKNGLDQVIFEFQGPKPNYEIQYLRSPFYINEDESKERIRIAGNAFIQVGFYFMRADEIQQSLSEANGFFPQGKLRMPSLRQLTDRGVWEGGHSFVLGIRARQKFRVTELSNPTQVVIDIKH